jgi:hypothetical protein
MPDLGMPDVTDDGQPHHSAAICDRRARCSPASRAVATGLLTARAGRCAPLAYRSHRSEASASSPGAAIEGGLSDERCNRSRLTRGSVALADGIIRQGLGVKSTARSRGWSPVRSAFSGFRFPAEVIVVAVRWYLRYGLSYRDVEELLAERGVEVDHVTAYRWVQRVTPLLADAARFRSARAGRPVVCR